VDERAVGRAGTEGGSEEMEFVVVDDDKIATGWVGAAPAVPRSQGLGGEEAIAPSMVLATSKNDCQLSPA
jgi:hypothetical protein